MLDRLSDYLAQRKGFLPLLGVLLVTLNFALQFVPGLGRLAESNALLHMGVILAILGLLLAKAL